MAELLIFFSFQAFFVVSGHALQSSALDAHVGDFTAATAETYV